jgi:transposase
MGKHRVYDPEFKLEAVKLVVEEGQTIISVEDSLGIRRGVLNTWVKKYRDRQSGAFQKGVDIHPLETQLRAQKKEMDRLRRERDILKKASAIFSTDPNRYSRS